MPAFRCRSARNNGRTLSLTQQAGYVDGNPNLAAGGARIILNEVTSTAPSQLRGYTEVAGERAEVVIANPNGITCDGCGFINTARGMLTTGAPRFGAAGALAGFDVMGGAIHINGTGLNAAPLTGDDRPDPHGSVDRLDLLARAVTLNARIWASELNVVTGANAIEYADLNTTPIAGAGERPTVSLDVSSLGGMYAESIRLIGTEAGLGVASSGEIIGGEVEITQAGRVVLRRAEDRSSLLAGDTVSIRAEAIDNAGRIDGDSVTIEGNALSNTATVIGDVVTLTADRLTNQGPAALIGATERLALYADELYNTDQAEIHSLGDMTIAGDAARDSDGRLLHLTTRLVNRSSLIEAGGNLELAVRDLENLRAEGAIGINSETVSEETTRLWRYGGYTVPAMKCKYFRDTPCRPEYVTSTAAETQTVSSADILAHDEARRHITFNGTKKVIGTVEECTTYGTRIVCTDKEAIVEVPAVIEAYYDTLEESPDGITIAYYPGYDPAVHVHPSQVKDGRYEKSNGDKDQHQETYRDRSETITEDRFDPSELGDPARILAGGDLRLDLGGTLTNDAGTIAAGGDLDVIGWPEADAITSTLTNRGYELQRRTTVNDVARVEVHRRCGRTDKARGKVCGNSEIDLVLPPQLADSSVIGGETALISAGGRVHLEGVVLDNQTVVADGAAPLNAWSYQENGRPVSGLGRSVERLAGGLYGYAAPERPYLIETDPRFRDRRAFLSSDYMLERLGLDGPTALKRLGDGFIEQQQVRDQLLALDGAVLGAGHENAEAHFRALMESGVAVAERLELVPGVALTDTQMAALTHDIVWMVEQTVVLPDGRAEQALAPVVYLTRARPLDLWPNGLVLAGESLELKSSGTLANSGRIAGGTELLLSVGRIDNDHGVIDSLGTTTLSAETDIINTSGRIAGEQVALAAGRDITHTSATVTLTDQLGNAEAASTFIQQRGVIESRADLDIHAGGQLTLAGSDIQAGGGASLSSDGALVFDTVATGTRHGIVFEGGDYKREDATEQQRATVTAGDDLRLNAGGNATLTGASLQAGETLSVQTAGDLTVQAAIETRRLDEDLNDEHGYHRRHDYDETVIGSTLKASGDVVVTAGGGEARDEASGLHIVGSTLASESGAVHLASQGELLIEEARERHSRYSESYEKDDDVISSTTTAQRDEMQLDRAVGSLISARAVTVDSAQDLTLRGSTLVADGDIALRAAGDVNILHAEETRSESHHYREKRSGFYTDGGSLNLGSRRQDQAGEGESVTSVGSTVGSLTGNVGISAGRAYTQSGGQLRALAGDIDVAAQRIELDAAIDRAEGGSESHVKQSGLSWSLSSPVVTAAETVDQMIEARSKTEDSRLDALAAATGVLAVQNGADAIAAKPQSLGGVTVSLSLGQSRSDTQQTYRASQANSAHLAAAGDMRLRAQGAGEGSDIELTGATLEAGGRLDLQAEDELLLHAAANRYEQHSNSRSRSASVGIAVTLGGEQTGLTFNAAASRGRGAIDGEDLTWTNTQLRAGETLRLESGADTLLRGATAKAARIEAHTGGDLILDSLQDSHTYEVDERTTGVGMSLCIPPFCTGVSTASLNHGRTEITSHYLSVTEQTGLYAGAQGFDLTVSGHTDLTGAVIASEAPEAHNRLRTQTLATRDLENRAEYDAQSVNLSLGYGSLIGQEQSHAPTRIPHPRGDDATTMSAPGLGGLSAGIPVTMRAEDDAASTTHSAISSAAITITDETAQRERTGQSSEETIASVRRDTQHAENALAPIFDEHEIRTGFEITEALIGETGTFLDNRAQESKAIEQQIRAELARGSEADSARLLELSADLEAAQRWAPGGTYRQIVTAFTAAATGDVSASGTEYLRRAAVNYLQSLAAEQIKSLADQLRSEPARLALHALNACAGAAAQGNECQSGALGASLGVLINDLLGPADGLNPEQREARKNLITTLVAGLATGLGSDDIATPTGAAQIETENNALKAAVTVGKIAYKTLHELHKAGKLTKDNLITELKKQGADELTEIADDLLTLFGHDASALERLLAVLDLATGLDANKSKGQALAILQKEAEGVRGGITKTVEVSKSRFPESAQHIEDAVAAGKPSILTIDRANAASRRRDALRGTEIRPSLDRDEFPPAMFQEGGQGSSVRHINPGDNRGAGACIGAQCRDLPVGSKVQIDVVD
ncbi:MAG: hemagglutinin repeat-containing protein [Pseudomonadota bacterium]